MTSACAVGVVKRMLPRRTKIGHAGTLDPFATGILLLLIGSATRQCERLMNQPKHYLATVKLGAYTATDDPEAPEQPIAGAGDPGIHAINSALTEFVGTIEQIPPDFSALKIGGLRAYQLARQGESIRLASRKVMIHSIENLHYLWPALQLKIICGRGTYIRSIARDLGKRLGTGGYLTSLRRSAIGPYTISHAATLDMLRMDGVQTYLTQVEPS